MGKVRLDCPNCGKAIAVSDTAKKARCPGCKEVIDLTAEENEEALESEGLEAEDTEEEELEADEGDEEELTEDEEEEEEEAPKKSKKKGSQRISSRRISKTISAGQSGGSQALMIGGIAALVVAVAGIFIMTPPWAGVFVASMVFVYLDATFAGVTRLSPGGSPNGSANLLWGLMGLFIVPTIIYFIFRTKLLAASAEDIGDASMSAEDLEDEGKVARPGIGSVGTGVIAIAAVALVAGLWKVPSLELNFGKPRNAKNPKATLADWSRSAFDQGAPFAVRLKSGDPLEGFDKVECKVYGSDGGEIECEVIDNKGAVVDDKTTDLSENARFAHFLLKIPDAGNYRVDLIAPDGGSVVSGKVRIRRRK